MPAPLQTPSEVGSLSHQGPSRPGWGEASGTGAPKASTQAPGQKVGPLLPASPRQAEGHPTFVLGDKQIWVARNHTWGNRGSAVFAHPVSRARIEPSSAHLQALISPLLCPHQIHIPRSKLWTSPNCGQNPGHVEETTADPLGRRS